MGERSDAEAYLRGMVEVLDEMILFHHEDAHEASEDGDEETESDHDAAASILEMARAALRPVIDQCG